MNTVVRNPTKAVNQKVYNDATYDAARVAHQVVLQPNTQHHFLISKKLQGLFTIEQRAMSISLYCTPLARGIMVILPKQPFHIFASTFSDRRVYLLKHMIVTQCGTFLKNAHTVPSTIE